MFAVVEAKRVPLAPELAGYLALEVADGSDAGSGDVDPKTVFISEDGTVALVRPKRDVVTGDAEASVRVLLSKLLEASGSGTPALTNAAKRKPGNGLPALVEELEAALIPVNRAAGRRALARLVREVKRVLLGVGRNASGPPLHARTETKPMSVAPPHARPVLRRLDSDPKFTPVRPGEPTERAAPVRPNAFDEEPTMKRPPLSDSSPRVPDSRPRLPEAPLESLPKRDAIAAPIIAEAGPAPAGTLSNDEVDSLLGSFGVSNAQGEKQLARDLKAMAGLSPTPPPPDPRTIAELTKDIGKDLPKRLESGPDGDSVEALLALADASAPLPAAATPQPVAPPPVAPPPVAPPPLPPPYVAPPPLAPPQVAPRAVAPPPLAPAPVVPPPPAPVASNAAFGAAPGRMEPAPQRTRAMPAPNAIPAPNKQPRRAPRTGMGLLVFALFVLVGATAATWKFAPQVFTGRRNAPAPVPVPSALVPPAPKCKVALVLSDVPTNAEILLRVGQAPADVERMPVGTRLEFVATAEGYAPRRAVVKGDSPWDKGPDGKPRIEIPIQLDPSKVKPGTTDPWPPAEPGSQVGGSGAPGSVHVVSNVRGAEVWLLAGLGPEARIDQLRCDADIDVLLAGPPALRRRFHVGENDIAATQADATGNKVVSLSAKDTPKLPLVH